MTPAWLIKKKVAVYKLLFRNLWSKAEFPLIKGKELQSLRKVMRDRVDYKESICNAGFVLSDNRYVCVAKNQRFSFCHEMGLDEARGWPPLFTDDDRKILYQIIFHKDWRLDKSERLEVFLDGNYVTPEQGVEDIRLFLFNGEIWAYATGSGNRRSAWPLFGKLQSAQLNLESAKASFSAPQKNWMPFEFDGTLYLEYSINPHIILEYEPTTANCKIAYSNERHGGVKEAEIHGGAPALRLDDRFFLGVGNSQHRYWYQERYYAAVFYLFEAKPPFRVISMTKPLRIQSHRERIHYVTGMAFSEDRRLLIVSIGICDCDNKFISIQLESVLDMLHFPN